MNLLTASIIKRAWSGMNILVLALFLLLVIWSRFYSLSTAGVWDNDAFQFLSISKDYSQGHIYPTYYKYGYVFLGALSIHIMGYHDVNLHYVNALADVVNVVLILLIMRALSLPLLVSIGAASLYAVVPQVLFYARWPLSNSLAVTGVLGAIYCAMLAMRTTLWRRVLLLAASGFFAIYAAMAHPTALSVFFVIGFLTILADIGTAWPRWSVRLALVDSFVYGAGGFLAFLLLALLLWGSSTADGFASTHAFGTADGFASALWEHAIGGLFSFRKMTIGPAHAMMPMAAYARSISQAVINGLLPFWMWMIFLVVFALLVVRTIVYVLRNAHRQPGDGERPALIALPMGVFVALIFVSSFFSIKAPLVPRYFLPIVPLICMIITGGGFIILQWWRIPRIVATLLVCVSAIWASSSMFREYWPTYKGMTSPTLFRQVAVALAGKINDRHRLLVAPSTFDPGTGYFSLYFRPLPMRLKPGWKMQKVKDALAPFGIKYICVILGVKDTVAYQSYAVNYGALPGDYSLEQEYADLNNLLQEVSARLFHETPDVKIYELPETGEALRAPVEKGGIVEGTPFFVTYNILNPVDGTASQRR